MDSNILGFIFLFVLILLSAFFSSAETALMMISNIRLRTLANSGKKSANILIKVFKDKTKMLSAILIGNNIVNVAATALTTSLTFKLFNSYYVSITAGILTIIILVFGEICPKTLASRNPEILGLLYARPIYLIILILNPFIFLVNFFSNIVLSFFGFKESVLRESMTQEEIRTIVDVSHEEGMIETEERKMINNVFDFGETIVRDLMKPRIDIVAIDVNASFDELLTLYQKERYTRIPVYDKKVDNIIGIVNVKDILLDYDKENFNIRKIMREALYTYEQMEVAKLLVEMKKNFHNIAIVLDEYSTVAGLLSLEDILEEIFGEIRDEYDTEEEEENIKKIGDKKYLIDAAMKIDDINEYFSLNLSSYEYESIGGFVIEKLGHIPSEKEKIVSENIKLEVKELNGNRIEKLILYIS